MRCSLPKISRPSFGSLEVVRVQFEFFSLEKTLVSVSGKFFEIPLNAYRLGWKCQMGQTQKVFSGTWSSLGDHFLPINSAKKRIFLKIRWLFSEFCPIIALKNPIIRSVIAKLSPSYQKWFTNVMWEGLSSTIACVPLECRLLSFSILWCWIRDSSLLGWNIQWLCAPGILKNVKIWRST